jgi:hypothetical protein
VSDSYQNGSFCQQRQKTIWTLVPALVGLGFGCSYIHCDNNLTSINVWLMDQYEYGYSLPVAGRRVGGETGDNLAGVVLFSRTALTLPRPCRGDLVTYCMRRPEQPAHKKRLVANDTLQPSGLSLPGPLAAFVICVVEQGSHSTKCFSP